MKINITKRDIIWSYIGTILSMGSNFLMLPMIIFYMNDSMVGLWYVFASIGTIATLFDFGFSVTFARNITYCWSGANKLKKEDVEFIENKEPDYLLMKQVIDTCRLIYFIISLIALVLLLTVGTIYINNISKTINGNQHMIAWFIYAFATFINLYYGYFASFLRGVGAIKEVNKNTIIARILQIILTFFLLFYGMGIIGISIAYLAYGIVFRALGKYEFYDYQKIGENLSKVIYNFNFQKSKELFYIVWHNAWRDGIISISNYLSIQASTLICAMYLSLADTGNYSIGVQISMAIAVVAGILYSTYQPALQETYISANRGQMQIIMSRIVTGFVILFLVCFLGVVMIGVPILKYIKPDINLSLSMLFWLSMYQFILKFRDCYTSYFSCTNRIIYVTAFVLSSLLCILLSIIFIGKLNFGIQGLIAAQIISQIVYNVWYWPYKAHKELAISFFDLLKIGFSDLSYNIRRILS